MWKYSDMFAKIEVKYQLHFQGLNQCHIFLFWKQTFSSLSMRHLEGNEFEGFFRLLPPLSHRKRACATVFVSEHCIRALAVIGRGV